MTTLTSKVTLLCAICGKPCDLETCKADADGKAVHEDCLVNTLSEGKGGGLVVQLSRDELT